MPRGRWGGGGRSFVRGQSEAARQALLASQARTENEPTSTEAEQREEERRAGGPVGAKPLRGQQSLFPEKPGVEGEWRTVGGRPVLIREFNESDLSGPINPIRIKYIFGRATMVGQPPLSTERVRGGRNEDGSIRLPSRRPPDTRPGMIPLSGNNPADPYQYIGHIRQLPKMMLGPSYTVPPNWPARNIDNEVGRSAYPGSQEPVRVDSGYVKPRVQSGDLTVGADFTRNVTVFSSHYGEGRQVRVPAWRYGV